MISPFKSVIGGAYKAVEHRLEAAIHIRFGLPATLPAEIRTLTKRADHVSAYFEAVELAGFQPAEAEKLFGRPKGFPERLGLDPWPIGVAQARFLERFHALDALVQGGA